MATLIPRSGAGREMPLSEQRVLERLSRLDDSWRVYHGVRFVVPPVVNAPAREGEIDFLLLHPDHGMLVLEAKGGGVEFDARDAGFVSVDRAGIRNRIADPFRQASSNMHALKNLIAARRGWSDTGVDFVYGHGVVLSDCRWTPAYAPAEMPREIVLDREDLFDEALETRLVGILRFWARNRRDVAPLGIKRLKRLSQFVLAPHFSLTPSLSDQMAWDEAALIRLSDEQETVLDFLDRNPRAIVEGCSGSGKTLIAQERVRRLAASGKRVLFLCFNRILGRSLASAVTAFGGARDMVMARTFHQLCRDLWEEAGHEWTGEPARDDRSAEAGRFWREESAWRLVTAATELTRRFDALVVDEAQDFESSWWTPLRELLVEPASSAVTLCLDPEQDLWERASDFGEQLPAIPIRSNRRSTRSIAEFASRIAKVRVRHPWGVPDGEWPTVSRWTTEAEQLQLVEGKVRYLLERERLDLTRTVIIGMHAWERSFLRQAGRVGEIPVRSMDDDSARPEPDVLRYSTPHRFKGLEADVVLLVDVDGDPRACSTRNLYVAASRARHRLFVFARPGVELPG